MSGIDRREIYERDNGICCFCKQPVPYGAMQLDHRIPRALGGPTTDANLRVAHGRCNVIAGHEVARERARRGLPRVYDVLQVRIGNGERALSKETYRAMRMAAIDERKSLGQIIEEAWAARLLQNKAELLAGSSGEGAGPARR